MAFKYRIKHPNGQYVRESGNMPGGVWVTEKVELVDDRRQASHYLKRSEARGVFAAFPGVKMEWEPV